MASPNQPDSKKIAKMLFTPCKNKQALDNWLRFFLDIELPNCTVDPISNSNPLDLMWEIYQKAMEGTDPNFTELLLYSSRSGYKTVLSGIIIALALFHFRRSSCLVAALEAHAGVTAGYVEKHLKRPHLSKYLDSKNKRTIEVCWYEDSNRKVFLSSKEYEKAPDAAKALLVEKRYYTKILVATMSSLNSSHTPLVIADEVDLAPPKPLEEMKMIPDRGDAGQFPITFYTSTRKFSFGPVQKLIDNANNSGINIRHWNIIDVCQACPEHRHRPDLPKIQIFSSDHLLRAVGKKEYEEFDDEKKANFVEYEGYQGCLSNCKIFAACKGRLATHQKSTSPLLKDIDGVQSLFRSTSLDAAKAQLLCWKPSTEGMIYPRIDRDMHMLRPHQIAEMITGIPHDHNLSKRELIQVLKQMDGVKFYAGMDFGYTHCFAVCVAAVWGNKAFFLDAYEVPELELNQQIALCEAKIKHYNPQIFADVAYPAYIKTFKRYKFQMRDWKKTPDSVVGGIEIVRQKLMPTIGQPEVYLLRDDEGCELLFKRMAAYHWKINSEGNATDTPDDEDDDLLDAQRYLLMNVFSIKGKILAATAGNIKAEISEFNSLIGPQDQLSEDQYTEKNWMRKLIQEATGDNIEDDPNDPLGNAVSGNGRFKFVP